MSHSLYNIFMPSRHLNPRASGLIVFGGGAEEGYNAGGSVSGYAPGGIVRKDYSNTDGFTFHKTFDIDRGVNTDGRMAQEVGNLSDGRRLLKIGDGYRILSADGNKWDAQFNNLEEAVVASGYTKPKFVADSVKDIGAGGKIYTYQGRNYNGAEWSNLNSNSQQIEDINTQQDKKYVQQYRVNNAGQIEAYAIEEGSEEINNPNTGLPYEKVVQNQQAQAETNLTTTSSAATQNQEGNTMAEENPKTTEIKTLNDRLTNRKQNLLTQQRALESAQKTLFDLEAENATSPSSTLQRQITDEKAAIAAKATNVTNAQNEVNALAGELGVKSQGAATEKAVLAAADPAALVESAAVAKIDSETTGTKLSDTTGQVSGDITATRTDAATPVIAAADTVTAETVTTDLTATKSKEEADKVKAVKGIVSDDAKVDAAQGKVSDDSLAKGVDFDKERIDEVTSGERTVTSEELATAQGLDEEAVKANIAEANVPDNIKAAQTKVLPNEIPKPAQIKEADMATAVAVTEEGLTADATATAAKLAKFTVDAETLVEFKEGKIEAEDTVQGQLASLMLDFDDGTPAWAAGAMRAARAAMASRGLGGSSMAMAAIVQASMESAIPIASADANAFREMKLNNLGRQQQVALSNAAAQQGVEIANFNAEQQTALQNSQNSFALQSQNLSNKQAVVLANAQIKASLQGQNLSNQQQSNIAEAARYAEVSNLNLNNRQQGILQDNANEMQVNLANLSAKQQAYIANAQLEAALQGKKIDNKQQVSIENAARFAEANNLTFTAKEQAKIHNSELMKTIGLAELNSKQAATLQNAATIASMDLANLNNRQQAAVQNARAFLEMDITNLNNEQQVVLFKAEAIQQALLTDAAATNATKQFNATSENQTNQFMANLATNIATSNATLANSTNQFNAGEKNATSQFNASIKNQREQFNQEQALVIAQANATWKQNCVTLDTAAQNDANSQTALAVNTFTQAVIDQIWQRERDLMDFAYKGAESSKDRVLDLVLADKKYEEYAKARADQEQTDMWSTLTTLAVGYMKYG